HPYASSRITRILVAGGRDSLRYRFASVTGEGFFGADENTIPVQDRRAVNLPIELLRGNDPPIRFVGHHADHAGFAGEEDFSIAGDRRGVITARSGQSLFRYELTRGGLQPGHDAAVLDHPKHAVLNDGRRDI